MEGVIPEPIEITHRQMKRKYVSLLNFCSEPSDPANFITDDFLQVLEEHRKICEKEGKLDEAQAARKRLKELKILNENRKRETLINNHKQEMQALENAHLAEIKELLAKWNNIIIPNFENEASLLELELKKR